MRRVPLLELFNDPESFILSTTKNQERKKERDEKHDVLLMYRCFSGKKIKIFTVMKWSTKQEYIEKSSNEVEIEMHVLLRNLASNCLKQLHITVYKISMVL